MSSLPSRRPCIGPYFLWPFAAIALVMNASGARADLQTNTTVALSGSLWGAPYQSSFGFDNAGNLSAMNMNVQGQGFNAGLGDVYAEWDNLGFAQRSFRGLSLGVPLGKAEATLIGGSVVVVDEFGQEKSSPLYGVRAALPLGKKWSLNASQLFSSNSNSSGQDRITSTGLSYQFSKRSRVSFEQAASSGGGGWQLSGESMGKRLSLRASYRQTQTGFSDAANPLLLTNRSGGFLSMSYRLSKPLLFSASSQRYSDGFGGNSSADSFRLQYSSAKRPQLSLFWEARALQYTLQTGESNDSARSTGIEASHSIGGTSFSLRYAQVERVGSAFSTANGLSNEVGLQFSRQFNPQTRLTFIGNFSLSQPQLSPSGQLVSPTARNFAFVNLERRVARNTSVNAGFQYQTSDVFGNPGKAFGVRAGFRIPLSNGTSVGLQYQKRIFSSGTLQNTGNDTLFLNFSQNFNSGRKANTRRLPRSQQKLLGQLSGRVFEDLNGNGRWDEGEPGIPDIALNLKGNLQNKTDGNGKFSFAAMPSGQYQVRLITKTLPIALTTLTPTQVPVLVGAGQSLTLDFPVMKTGKVHGTVFRDDNRNGRQDDGELPISEAIVQAEGSETIAFTDERGRFTLAGLTPRRWNVVVDTQLRADNLGATNTSPIEVAVPANGEVSGVQLGLAPIEKAVINTFQKGL